MKKTDTYRELLEELKKMSDSQLDSNLTYHDLFQDEFLPVTLTFSTEDDVLDKDHPYFETKVNFE